MIRSQKLFKEVISTYRRSNSTANKLVEKDLVNKKVAYKKQLSELRKQWKSEHEMKLEAERKRKLEAKRAVVLKKAVKLRERSVVSAQNIKLDKERKEQAMIKYKQHITKNNLVAENRESIKAGEYEKLFTDLMEEQECWIKTPEQADILINDSLFEKPATTGLSLPASKYWRHMCVPFNLDVLFNADFQSRYGPTDASPEDRYLEAMSNKRLQVQDMLNSMISSGAERQHYSEIVDQYVELYTESDTLLESNDFLDEEEEFVKEMQEESGLDDEEALFKYIEREINERSYGASAAEEEEEDEEEEEIEEVVVEEAPVLAKKGKKGAKKAPSGPDLDSEVGNLDMSIFDTAEENMSRELGEDVAGAAAAAAKKASTKLMQQKKGKKGKK